MTEVNIFDAGLSPKGQDIANQVALEHIKRLITGGKYQTAEGKLLEQIGEVERTTDPSAHFRGYQTLIQIADLGRGDPELDRLKADMQAAQEELFAGTGLSQDSKRKIIQILETRGAQLDEAEIKILAEILVSDRPDELVQDLRPATLGERSRVMRVFDTSYKSWSGDLIHRVNRYCFYGEQSFFKKHILTRLAGIAVSIVALIELVPELFSFSGTLSNVPASFAQIFKGVGTFFTGSLPTVDYTPEPGIHESPPIYFLACESDEEEVPEMLVDIIKQNGRMLSDKDVEETVDFLASRSTPGSDRVIKALCVAHGVSEEVMERNYQVVSQRNDEQSKKICKVFQLFMKPEDASFG